MATIQIPIHLRKLVAQQEQLSILNGKLIESLKELIAVYPALKPYLLDDNENLCHFVNLYVNGQDVRFAGGLQTEVQEKDVITLILAIAGG